jgi:ABC-type multidrug transport system ATPase subunit
MKENVPEEVSSVRGTLNRLLSFVVGEESNSSGDGDGDDDEFDDAEVVNVWSQDESHFNMEVVLSNLVHDVPIKTGFCKSSKKELLHGIDARFCSGQLVALMGASGAGKTTLLSVLRAGRNPGMTVNGHRMPSKFAKLCCTIPQADILYPALTPEQSVLYSAMLRLPEGLSRGELVEKVRNLLDELRLTKCKDSPIGNEDRRGISGGERKRTSIAMELIANPSVLLVDEPTSGLDSKSAEDVIRLLRDVARRGKIVICTIHQPSWSMFEHFDKLLLLHHGLVVYHGGTGKKMRDFFHTRMGLNPPAFENPLDFYMREIQTRDGPFFTDKWAEVSARL